MRIRDISHFASKVRIPSKSHGPHKFFWSSLAANQLTTTCDTLGATIDDLNQTLTSQECTIKMGVESEAKETVQLLAEKVSPFHNLCQDIVENIVL